MRTYGQRIGAVVRSLLGVIAYNLVLQIAESYLTARLFAQILGRTEQLA